MTDTTKQIHTSGICYVCHQRVKVKNVKGRIMNDLHNHKGTRICCEGSTTAPVKLYDQDGVEMRIMGDDTFDGE